MPEVQRRLVDRIIDADFTSDLPSRSIPELKQMRDQAREAETEISFERRLCQGRIDILSAELDRRSGKISGDLISNLPGILAGEGRTESAMPLPTRAPDMSMPRSADAPRRRVDELVAERTLARLPDLPESEIRDAIERVAEHERVLSERRKQVHDVLDRIQDEIVERYKSGEEDPNSLLG